MCNIITVITVIENCIYAFPQCYNGDLIILMNAGNNVIKT